MAHMMVEQAEVLVVQLHWLVLMNVFQDLELLILLLVLQ